MKHEPQAPQLVASSHRESERGAAGGGGRARLFRFFRAAVSMCRSRRVRARRRVWTCRGLARISPGPGQATCQIRPGTKKRGIWDQILNQMSIEPASSPLTREDAGPLREAGAVKPGPFLPVSDTPGLL